MKLTLKGHRFDRNEINAKSQEMLKILMKKGFQECFLSWQKGWDHCIVPAGDDVQEDGGVFGLEFHNFFL